MGATGRFLAWAGGLLPCNQAIAAVKENMRATSDLRETVSHFDKTLERLEPAIHKIADAVADENARDNY